MSLMGCLCAATAGATPVMWVVRNAPAGVSLLRNGGFEATAGKQVANWQAWQNGFQAAPGEGHAHSRAITCENRSGQGEFGASQTVTLNQRAAAPVVVRGWSKAQDVSGSADSGYSIYVDLTYADGTPLWGQTSDFRCGTHDWERRELVIQPEKPVRSLTVYCLFRGHTGKVWFDDVAVEEVRVSGSAVLFQGVPVRLVRTIPPPRGAPTVTRTGDGLQLMTRRGVVTSLRIGGRELAGGATGGFLARDAATNSDVCSFVDGSCPELGLKVHATYAAKADHIAVSGRVSDTTRRDRAVTLVFALPLSAPPRAPSRGWRWGDDIRHSRVIEGTGEYANTVTVRCGATGSMSLYPLAAVSDGETGLALALDMGQPAVCRLAYHAGTKQLLIAYDFGLVKDTQRFPSSADFRFVIYRFDPRWGFRGAFRKLMGIFPQYFAVRSHEQGLWMPFTDVSTVQGWQDFGFRYHEGDNNVPFDDAHGILSFHYTEPMTWWMPMKKGVPRTTSAALQVRDELAGGGDPPQRRMAQVTRVAAMVDAEGQPALLFRSEPWNDGAVWSLNPNPSLPGALNAATVYWNEAIKRERYGPQAKGQLDGEYLDSLEGYVTAELNFARDQFRFSTVPLTFASATKQPALFKGLAAYEFTRWLSEDVHRMGKLMFANSVPNRFTFLCPWLDVMGTETDWLHNGAYQPASDAEMSLWRTMSGAKPYLLLMNTNFDSFTPDRVEKYFQRSLFYGIYPGMFSHNAADNPYWHNSAWYNRDRLLFRKYIPLIRRVAEAGWQPVTAARSDNPAIYLERFGPDARGTLYLTLMNESAQPQSGVVRIDAAALRLNGPLVCRELVRGKMLGVAGASFRVSLAPQETWAVELGRTR
jgi:hypothetical protein